MTKKYLSSLWSKKNNPPEESHSVDRVQSGEKQDPEQENDKNSDEREDLKLRLENMEIVNELGQVVTSSLSLDEVFEHIYKTINSMMDASVLELSIYDDNESLSYRLSNVKEHTDIDSYSNQFAVWSYENEQEVILDEADTEFGRYVFEPLKSASGEIVKSVLVFPILTYDRLLGTLCVMSYRQNAFDKFHIEMLRSLLPYTSVAVVNAGIHQQILSVQEQIVREKQEAERQKEEAIKQFNRSEELLLNILPKEIAEELKVEGKSEAKLHDQITVVFTDFFNFTQATEQLSAHELVKEIHDTYSKFDEIITQYGLEKIKTIGDSYMFASGLPVYSEDHAIKAVEASLALSAFIEDNKEQKEAEGKHYFELRIGVHSGPVIAGIVGVKKFAYDIWGDTVNVASRMESAGEIGRVNISKDTYELVKDHFECEYRGMVDAKNKGKLDMYFANHKA